MIRITLKGGIVKEYAPGMSVLQIAEDISAGLARVACAGKLNGEMVDLRTIINEPCELEILTFDDKDGKWAFRHTGSHILAQAVQRLFPEEIGRAHV